MQVQIADTRLDAERELDCQWVFQTLCDWEPDRGIIESCFNNNGLVEMGGKYIAICELLGCRLEKVAVNRWKKVMLGTSTNDKQLSVTTCQKLLPTADLMRPTPAGRKVNVNHDRAEAVLLALYLMKTLS